MNIGTVVRNANAFLASGVHIVAAGGTVGSHVDPLPARQAPHRRHDLAAWAAGRAAPGGIDGLPGSVPIGNHRPAAPHVLVLGGGPGPDHPPRALEMTCSIAQLSRPGRSQVAGIAMHTWIRQHASAHDLRRDVSCRWWTSATARARICVTRLPK
jgi:hypothetical protein